MILFIDDINLLNCIDDKFIVLNLSSFYSGYDSITNLITMPLINYNTPMNQFVDTPEFDLLYANNIFNNIELFRDLMKIMIYAYEGFTVVILVNRDPYRDTIMESLIKIIQERYGYSCWIINDIDDLECARETTFSTNGLITMDNDIQYFESLYQQGQVEPILDRCMNVE